MNKNISFAKAIFISLLFTIGFVACESDPEPGPNAGLEAPHGVFILNQGGEKQNNASLSFYDLETGNVATVPFSQNKPLGDVGQDMLLYGGKLYITVFNSSNIRVLDAATKQDVKQIELFTQLAGVKTPLQPRYMAAYKNYIYVTCWTGGQVVRIDTASLSSTGSVTVGSHPEGIAACPQNDKLYVANCGKGAGETVSIINTASFDGDSKIEVGLNPNFVKTDSGNYIYLTYQGDFGFTVPGGFQRIDVRNNSITDIAGYPKADFALHGDYAYFYDVTYDPADWSTELLFGKFRLTGNLPFTESAIISDDTKINSPYGIAIHPDTEDVYIMDAGDYVNPGKVYVFDSTGKKKREFTVGVSPCKVVFY